MAGGLTFVADRSGAVRALNDQGQIRWTTLTGGPVYYSPTIADGRLFVGSADGRVYALEAATGRLLWTYRVAPQARWMPVYGKLISTWPVAGGVVVEEGVVYAAAGIAHFDGTYVVALDAATGKPRWRNDTSGALSPQVNCGISLQGELQIRGDELQFLGGGAYQFGRYDRRTGKCLNEPRAEVSSQFQTAFYPYFPHVCKVRIAASHVPRRPHARRISPAMMAVSPRRSAVLEPATPTEPAPDRKGNARREAAGRSAATDTCLASQTAAVVHSLHHHAGDLVGERPGPGSRPAADPVGTAVVRWIDTVAEIAAGPARQGWPGHRSAQTYCGDARRWQGSLLCSGQRVTNHTVHHTDTRMAQSTYSSENDIMDQHEQVTGSVAGISTRSNWMPKTERVRMWRGRLLPARAPCSDAHSFNGPDSAPRR